MTASGLGAHVPWAQIDTCLAQVLDLGLAPEIAIKGPELDAIDEQLVLRTAKALEDAGLRPRVHAPFFDLNPGALDPLIRQATRQRLEQTLRVAGQLQADLMIVHPGVDKWRYPRLEHAWLDLAQEFFPPLVEQAEKVDCCLAIENIYEESPDILVQLVRRYRFELFRALFRCRALAPVWQETHGRVAQIDQLQTLSSAFA